MLTLKKSFELSNHLNGLLTQALNILGCTDNVTTTTEKHMKQKSYSEAENEEKVIDKAVEFPCTVIELVDFALSVQSEIAKLTIAMDNAKHTGDIDFDAMISINNTKRKLVSRLECMAALKAKTEMKTGTDYKFNGEGNQVPYAYPLEKVTTIDFDRNQIRGIINRLGSELDDYSTAIDKMQLLEIVDYDVVYDTRDKLDDAIEKYLKSAK